MTCGRRVDDCWYLQHRGEALCSRRARRCVAGDVEGDEMMRLIRRWSAARTAGLVLAALLTAACGGTSESDASIRADPSGAAADDRSGSTASSADGSLSASVANSGPSRCGTVTDPDRSVRDEIGVDYGPGAEAAAVTAQAWLDAVAVGDVPCALIHETAAADLAIGLIGSNEMAGVSWTVACADSDSGAVCTFGAPGSGYTLRMAYSEIGWLVSSVQSDADADALCDAFEVMAVAGEDIASVDQTPAAWSAYVVESQQELEDAFSAALDRVPGALIADLELGRDVTLFANEQLLSELDRVDDVALLDLGRLSSAIEERFDVDSADRAFDRVNDYASSECGVTPFG